MEKRNLEKISAATMFISFDLVNCTFYKASHKGKWASGVSEILEEIIDSFSNSSIENCRFWKILGDEIVYTKNIQFIHEIDDTLAEIYRIVTMMNKKIKGAKVGDLNTAKIMAVKATVWLADISPANLRADNFYAEYKVSDNQLQAEYLGTDIDTGFRIAQFTSANRLVVSFELAALFLKEPSLHQDFDKIHFVGYRPLKGIWQGNPYPIFMYHGDKSVSFKDSIKDTSNPKTAVLKEYLQTYDSRIVKPNYKSYEEQILSELCENETLNKEVVQLVDIIRAQNGALPEIPLPRLRVHYSVLCYCIFEGHIHFMIAKDDFNTLGFGGAMMNHNLQYLDTINAYYLVKHGFELKFINDDRYHDPIPRIMSTYQLPDKTCGSIFLAEMDTNEMLENFINENTHFYTSENAPTFNYYTMKESSTALLKQAEIYIKALYE
ncbi:MAG: hypothetical protein R3Y57_02000 [Erysipelotrichaceae bacterium]